MSRSELIALCIERCQRYETSMAHAFRGYLGVAAPEHAKAEPTRAAGYEPTRAEVLECFKAKHGVYGL